MELPFSSTTVRRRLILGACCEGTASPTITFTIRNDGDSTLTLKTFTGSTHFTITTPADRSLAAGESTALTITLGTNAVWSGSETISFLNNDSDNGDGVESPFTILLSGTVTGTVGEGDTIGLYNESASTFFLRYTDDSGYADSTFVYGKLAADWISLAGDWDGNGIDTVGLYDPATSKFYLEGAGSNASDLVIVYGPAGGGFTPIAGDWNGDGIDTIGLYDSIHGSFYLKNTNATGYADLAFSYGASKAGLKPLAGDWNGDSTDSVGLYDPTASTFLLRNSNSVGYADRIFSYGARKANLTPVVGDWNNDGVSTVGLYNAKTATFLLTNTNASKYADIAFEYGPSKKSWTPIIGHWANAYASVAIGGQVATSADTTTLSSADLQPIVEAAIARWAATGLNAATLTKLAETQFVISDLQGGLLGKTVGDRIYLDADAAGHGWFVDSTPTVDEEFAASADNSQLTAIDARAVDKIDLLTIVEHELGHIAGLDDADLLADDVMNGSLAVGVRRNA